MSTLGETTAAAPPLTPSTAERGTGRKLVPKPSLLARLYHGSLIAGLQGSAAPVGWANSIYWWWYGDNPEVSLSKTYECRPYLPVSVFFPKSYDQTSQKELPTLLTIHGGGFCLGTPEADGAWNRTFADNHDHLVVALNYAKSPWSPFPGPIDDVVSLALAVIGDDSLPINKKRISIGGFSAGGNLALAASQSKELRGLASLGWGIKACIPIYPIVDFTRYTPEKALQRRYKPTLPGTRGKETDALGPIADSFTWAYLPYGTDEMDPRISPGVSASRDDLPDHVFVIACELDVLSTEAWRFARRIAGLPPPADDEKPGRPDPFPKPGMLVPEEEDEEEKFGFARLDEGSDGQTRSVKWLLLPDMLHATDIHTMPGLTMTEECIQDAHGKALEEMKEIAGWLNNVVYASLDDEGR